MCPDPVFGIVAGEMSGDTLGADLIAALKKHYPQARFVGIAGPQMQAAGAETLFPMERLSVMGLVEVLGRLRELLKIRAELFSSLCQEKIDAFIGIDAPDFTLGLEWRFRQLGIPTIHYVSPSVWAWRQGRVKKIAQSTDLMLCLLPFEKQFYDRHQVHAVFVGHPLADTLPLEPDTAGARQALNLPAQSRVLALLPGSRGGEIRYVGPVLASAAGEFQRRHPDWKIIVPAINEERRQQVQELMQHAGVQATVYDSRRGAGVGREVMAAADLVWLASGTATLEAMLLKKPMVVLYRFHWLTYWIARLLVRVTRFSLPNLLAGKMLVPELIQQDACPERVLKESDHLLDEAVGKTLKSEFMTLHRQLKANAGETAAAAISELLRRCKERNSHGQS